MHKFSWYEAGSVEDALAKVNATVSEIVGRKPNNSSVVFKAGGVDLMDLMKEGLVNPETIVSIKSIPGLDKIEYDDKAGLRIGANATLGEIENNEIIKEKYLALHQAVAEAGTAQLRNSATLGGNLAQRTRCWYFRSIHHVCFRKGSGVCYAQHGENEFHAIINNSKCASVHASSVSTALMAFKAKVVIMDSEGKKKEVEIGDFFVHPETDEKRENILKANELITEVVIPPVTTGTKSHYIKYVARESHDWALADVAVTLEMTGGKCRRAEIVIGAAAPVPLRLDEPAKALEGHSINEKLAKKAGDIAMRNATPLAKNAYKIPVFRAIIKRAILKAV